MDKTAVDKRQHLISVIDDLDTGMLVTRAADGELRGRPMAIAEVREDGELYFCAGLQDPKVAEIEADPHVTVQLQGKTKWASISGTARVVIDRALVDRLWKESWRLWFPEGKDDPSLCFIAIDATEGEYWDNSGARGMRFAIEAAKAYLQGRTPDGAKMDENAKVSF